MEFYDTTTPYKELDHPGVQYNVCREFNHISRYKGLRQITHSPDSTTDRLISLENINMYDYDVPSFYYEVPVTEVNRLDIIARKFLGAASYSWVISYMNHIEDGYSVHEGQRLKIPEAFFSLFSSGQILASIPPMQLNLASE